MTATAKPDTDIPDAEVVEEEPSRELVHAPRRGEVLRPLDVAQQKDAMRVYQQGLQEILDESDWQEAGWDKSKGKPRRFVKKSGWRKIAAWFDLSIELIRDEVDRDENGQVTRACVWARAVAPSGRFADGDGYCDVAEDRFTDTVTGEAKAKGRAKLENDLRGTATTRAVNRAISNLVGMGDVSAEEVSDEPRVDSDRPFGPAYDREQIGPVVASACTKLAGGKETGITLFKLIAKDCGGYMPAAAAMALIRAASTENLVPDVTPPEPQ